MQMGHRERAEFEAALAASDASESESDRNEAGFMRQQLDLHTSYTGACTMIEEFADGMRDCEDNLVPLCFPLRLTHRTRCSVEDGMYRSYTRCLRDMHCAVLSQHGGEASDAVTHIDAFLAKMCNVMTLESCRVLDGVVTHAEARAVCISYIEKCRAVVVRDETAHLLTLDSACSVVLGVLTRFGALAAKMSRNVPDRMRAFLKASERKGIRAAAHRLASERQLREVMAKHGWLFGGACDDAKLVRIYELLLITHVELAQALAWQRRRVAWLASTSSANACWCGVFIATGVEGEIVQAPAHMRRFAGGERVRLVLEMREVPFSCYLSSVGVANSLLELLQTRRLPLNRIGAAYATRILTFDFCKYESAAQNILEDTLRPWCQRVNSGVVN
jgi:hypothetical protein